MAASIFSPWTSFHIQPLLPTTSPLCSVSHHLCFSVYQRDMGVLRHLSGSFVTGVNGLGRMKHCVPLSEPAIRFVGEGDQWGDLESVPAGDDGLMSLWLKNHEKLSMWKRITAQQQLCLHFAFSRAKYLQPRCFISFRILWHFYAAIKLK